MFIAAIYKSDYLRNEIILKARTLDDAKNEAIHRCADWPSILIFRIDQAGELVRVRYRKGQWTNADPWGG